MTRQELRVYLNGVLDGTGMPAEAAVAFMEVLEAKAPGGKGLPNALGPRFNGDGFYWLFIYLFEKLGLVDTGFTCMSGPLTAKGVEVLAALREARAEDETLLNLVGEFCEHGFFPGECFDGSYTGRIHVCEGNP